MLAYLVPGSAARPAVVDMHTRSWCAVASLPPHSPHMFAFAHVPPSCRAQDLGYLVTKRKLEDEDNFEDWVNHHSKVGAAAAAWGRAMGVLLLRLGRAQSGAAWMAGGGAWLLLLVGKATWVLPLGAVEQTRRH